MSDIEHARLLLSMARKDLTALAAMDDPEKFAAEIFGFHAQQAVEKGLKAWLAAWSVRYPLRHDLEELFSLLEKQGAAVAGSEDLADFPEYAVAFRYEGLAPQASALNRAEVCSKVQRFLDRVEGEMARGRS